MDIYEICRNGAVLDGPQHGAAGFAFLSLRLGLHAYFSTYRTMKYGVHLFGKGKSPQAIEAIDANTPVEYYESSAETILHLHHFAELVLKDILRTVHPLMADVASTHPVVLKKLLRGESLTPGESACVQSIEFREALDRVCELVGADQIADSVSLQFLVDSRRVLECLNVLRNRIWHRGLFVLRYDALDMLFCAHLLPVIRAVVALPRYARTAPFWKHRALDCGFDPLGFLALNHTPYDIGRTAFAKELGRAAYENPLATHEDWGRILNEATIARAEAAARADDTAAAVSKCPVCGVQALVVYDDVDTDGENLETGAYDRAWRYTWQVRCMCCTFEINHHLKNGGQYGIPVEDYWTSKELG